MVRSARLKLFVLMFGWLFLLGLPAPIYASEEITDYDIAIDLATMLQSARSVIAENQKLINDPTLADKGLTGEVVQAGAIEKFTKKKSSAVLDLTSQDFRSRLLKAQIDAIAKVMADNQGTINQPGVAFKGFVPAVFARLVNEEFKRTMGAEAEIKVTAPPELVRNRKARPDEWEIDAILNHLSAPSWEKGTVFSAEAENDGRKAFRVLMPEYYGQGCLSCHGARKGELDITGYPKEGGKLGDLGGVISVTLYRK